MLSTFTLEDYRNAPSGIGPLASAWKDKPHRLIYDLISLINRRRCQGCGYYEGEIDADKSCEGGNGSEGHRFIDVDKGGMALPDCATATVTEIDPATNDKLEPGTVALRCSCGEVTYHDLVSRPDDETNPLRRSSDATAAWHRAQHGDDRGCSCPGPDPDCEVHAAGRGISGAPPVTPGKYSPRDEALVQVAIALGMPGAHVPKSVRQISEWVEEHRPFAERSPDYDQFETRKLYLALREIERLSGDGSVAYEIALAATLAFDAAQKRSDGK